MWDLLVLVFSAGLMFGVCDFCLNLVYRVGISMGLVILGFLVGFSVCWFFGFAVLCLVMVFLSFWLKLSSCVFSGLVFRAL